MIWRRDAAPLHSPISLIPLCLSFTHRPPPCRSRKIGEDESDPPPPPPPRNGGPLRPQERRDAACPYLAPWGVALVLIDPCGKA